MLVAVVWTALGWNLLIALGLLVLIALACCAFVHYSRPNASFIDWWLAWHLFSELLPMLLVALGHALAAALEALDNRS